jgi:LmbE family N-acetylglucosaminyl deacetylase
MSTIKTLVAIFAHPDDESFGIGGTLARYAHQGVLAHYLCGTRGESGTVDPRFMAGYADVSELRSAELECASRELGLAGVHYLGYRDSGMPGSPDNRHPNSLFSASVDDVAGRIGEHLLRLKPDTVITHDKFGGYGHPDHIKLYHATVRAYELLYGVRVGDGDGDPRETADRPPAPRLYATAFPKGLLKFGVRVLPLIGQNPRQFGRNKDIDLVEMSTWVVPVTAAIEVRDYARHKERASACHVSQLPSGPQGNVVTRLLFRRAQKHESFSRLYPPVRAGEPVEHSLFSD